MTDALKISGLTKTYQDFVLDHVSFTVPNGSIVGLIGENGYQTPELLSRPYYITADMNKFLASIIDFMNHNVSMNFVRTPTDKIRELMKEHNRKLTKEA